MACNYIRSGQCYMLKKKCDDCQTNKAVFEDVPRQAVELRACPQLGKYEGATRCACSSNSLTHWFYCKERNRKVSAQKCVNCHEKKQKAKAAQSGAG